MWHYDVGLKPNIAIYTLALDQTMRVECGITMLGFNPTYKSQSREDPAILYGAAPAFIFCTMDSDFFTWSAGCR